MRPPNRQNYTYSVILIHNGQSLCQMIGEQWIIYHIDIADNILQ